ncbi:MAG: S9 family peptidase [Candidatus Latescibacterota bacterium]|nr:MAG: S9 family peptidase [Candidatus Latescibacterota bacterium]
MSRVLAVASIAALLIVPSMTARAESDDSSKLRLDLMLEWESVASPQLSPDGKQIVFTRSWIDKVNDKRKSELWIMDSDGGRPRHLVEGSEPQWSPDGRRIAFLREGKPNGPQIHVMWMDTREVTQITRVEKKPSTIRWSPDAKQLAFRMVVPEEEKLFKLKLPKRPKGAQWADDPKVITRLAYRRDRRGYRPQGFYHLFVVDAEGGTPRQVTDGDYDHQAGEWTPDGTKLVCSGLREEDADWQISESEIYAVDVATGAVEQLTDRRGPDANPKVSPDGRWIAYQGFDYVGHTYHVWALYVMDVEAREPRLLTADLDRRTADILWSRDSRSIYFTARSEGSRNLYRADLAGRVEQLTSGQLAFAASDLGARGLVVGIRSTAYEPADVARFDARSGKLERLTRVNDDILARLQLGEVEEIRYASVDGLEIQGWIVKPPDFDPSRKYPLILRIHGGPHAMYGVQFDFEMQNHAAEGFVVLYTNPRGSDGYGKEFGNAINHAYPGRDYDDLMRGVDAVIARGYVDEENLFVYGGSGGGVLTCWVVGMTDRFRAAVSMYPVTNWISFVGTTDGPYWYHNFEQYPWESIAEHWQRSPLRLVGNVTTPTLLITGELDLRTPMAQTEEYYQALKMRKVESAMVRIPDEYHGASGRHVSNRLRRILYVREWFNKYRSRDEAALEPAATAARE